MSLGEGAAGTFYYDTALSGSAAAMASVLAVTSSDHVVFGSAAEFA
ncbi:hypothetical protein [Nocardia sp. NBC_01327]|nr:hypothetical protein OG326_22885 [Nocardia sp. NBC_01327]